MKSARFFVTTALFVGTAFLMACEAYHHSENAKPGASAKGDVALNLSNAKLEEAMTVQAELSRTYSIILNDIRDSNGRLVKGTSLAQDYEWRCLAKAERRSVKEKLAQFMALASEVLQVDARKGPYLTNKERVTNSRDVAFAFQKSVEAFEKLVGENFEPKAGCSSPSPYMKSYEI
jgi:hypothetical protein